ncbi:MAG TPA: hypothetical protein V6C76_09475 [Drouetiella sp.]
MAGLLDSIAKRLKQVAFSFREKPAAKIDDYVLEHFLLYHGLVGSTPDNQRSYKDVRADIFEALDNNSSLQLGIALKVQPLWWDEKLKTIFGEAAHKERAPELLLPKLEDESWSNQSDPLGHPDWMVRANAANMLAHYKVHQADERMSRALNDTVDNGSAAFCHIAYALGRLGTEKAKDTLQALINADEYWFRVDVAGALAASQREDVYELLGESLFSNHSLQDYTAVAIAKYRKPLVFLNSSSERVQDAGCVLVMGLLQASKQTFNSELINESNLRDLLPTITELAKKKSNAMRINAAIQLYDWVTAQSQFAGGGFTTPSEDPRLIFSTPETEQMLQTALKLESKEALDENGWAACNQRYAIQLLGELQMQSALPDLLKLLAQKPKSMEQIIQALEDLGDTAATKDLVALANQLVDVKERAERILSKNPVAEEKERDSKIYWQILKALGNLPAPNSVALLTTAVKDFAPDKREQALLSLISVYEQDNSLMSKTTVSEILKSSLSDPASGMRVAALDGVARLNTIDLIEPVLDLFDARETSVAKQAKQTLTMLSMQGNEGKIEKELKARLEKETDQYKRKKISEFIHNGPNQ